MAALGKVEIDRERCKGCHLCLEVCPTESLEKAEELNRKGYQPASFISNEKKEAEGKKGCTGCTSCAIVCPEVAIEVYRAQ